MFEGIRTHLTTALFVALWMAGAWRIAELPGLFLAPDLTNMEDARLFQKALDSEIIRPQPDGRLEPLPDDEIWARRASGKGTPRDEAQERLLAMLYRSQVGRAVLASFGGDSG